MSSNTPRSTTCTNKVELKNLILYAQVDDIRVQHGSSYVNFTSNGNWCGGQLPHQPSRCCHICVRDNLLYVVDWLMDGSRETLGSCDKIYIEIILWQSESHHLEYNRSPYIRHGDWDVQGSLYPNPDTPATLEEEEGRRNPIFHAHGCYLL